MKTIKQIMKEGYYVAETADGQVGIELPQVSVEDDGKALVVNDGKWEAGSAGMKNLVDGSATGSVRGIGSEEESQSYTIGQYAAADGAYTKASGKYSHAEGNGCVASGQAAHAEGDSTTASGNYSHAEGDGTNATGAGAHAEGTGTIAQQNQHVQGFYNAQLSPLEYCFICGNGESASNRSNAFALKWDGTFVFADGTTISPNEFAAIKALIANNQTPDAT